MIESFNAFISYKHAPLDNRVAEEIQKGLERFRVPAAIKKKKGKQKIERIFRDKAELPITSSLSDNISYALEHSDFLIVICSHSTKLSAWVPREIEYFLKFHPISHVLTVLAEGEPGEVIPKQLLETTVVKTGEDGTILEDENGNPLTEKLMLEPLSCDWRLPRRKARKEELPRLAAAMLDCSYDELIMRSRQYRRRRNAVFFSIAAVLAAGAIAYLLWSRAQIQKNYEASQANLRQAQINQSVFLANASERILEQEHDGIGAIQLAMAALPEQGEDRPVVPEALFALTEAVRAYAPENSFYVNRFPGKKYCMGSPVKAMKVSEDRKTLFLLDDSGEVSGFDTISQEKVFSRAFEDAFTQRMSILPIGNDRLLVCDGFSLYLYDWKTGQEIWQDRLWVKETGETFAVSDVFANTNARIRFMGLVWKDSFPEVAMALSPDGKTLAVDGANDVIRLLDVATGAERERLNCYDSAAFGSGLYTNAIQKLIWSPNGETIAAVYIDAQAYPPKVCVMAYDTKQDKWHRFRTEERVWEDLCFAGDDRLVLMAIDDILQNKSAYSMKTASGTMTTLRSSDCRVTCFSLKEESTLWQSSLPWENPWVRPGTCAYDPTGQSGDGVLSVCISNRAFLLDPKEGTTLAAQSYPDTVLGPMQYNNGTLYVILADGNLASLTESASGSGETMLPIVADTGTPIRISQMLRVPDEEQGNTIALCMQEGCSDVIGFGIMCDPDGTALAGKAFESEPSASWITKDSLLVFAEDSLIGLDPVNGDLLYEVPLDGAEILADLEAGELGTGTDQMGFVLKKGDEYLCLLLDPADGTTETVSIGGPARHCRNGVLYWPDEAETNGFGAIMKFDLKNRTTERIEIRGPEGEQLVDSRGFYVSPDGTKAAMSTENNTICIVSLVTGEYTELKKESKNANYFCWSPDNRYFVLISNTMIAVFTADGEEVTRIPTEGKEYVASYFDRDLLYVVYGNAKLFRYRIADGREDGVVDISLYANDRSLAKFLFRDGLLYLNVGSKTGRMSVIDLSEMKRVCLLDDCAGYSETTDRFFVLSLCSDRQYRFYSFPRYTVEDLLRKGEELVGGSAMLPEMRARYGLE